VIKRVRIASPGEERVIRTVEGYRPRNGKAGARWQLGNEGTLVGYKLSGDVCEAQDDLSPAN
jgi:hypothetical protein